MVILSVFEGISYRAGGAFGNLHAVCSIRFYVDVCETKFLARPVDRCRC
jgi:hypothetical protein